MVDLMLEAMGGGAVGGALGGTVTVAGLGEVVRRYIVRPKIDELRADLGGRLASLETSLTAIEGRQGADDVRHERTDGRLDAIAEKLQLLQEVVGQSTIKHDALADTLREIRRDVRELRAVSAADR
tara:strand:- start:106 stop:483 length:378 start_codon:yes stop_codon:yes gene_type:complete